MKVNIQPKCIKADFIAIYGEHVSFNANYVYFVQNILSHQKCTLFMKTHTHPLTMLVVRETEIYEEEVHPAHGENRGM